METGRLVFLTIALTSCTTAGENTPSRHAEGGIKGFQGNKLSQLKQLLQIIENNRDSFKCLCDMIGRCTSAPKQVQGGATYIRWGRTSCPTNGTETVYTGYTAGSNHLFNQGSAGNYLCLPKRPEWAKYKDGFQGRSEKIYGTEYEVHQHGINAGEIFRNAIGEYDVPCAVCQSKFHTTSFMFPGKTKCYKGWHLEYRGYLMAQHREFSPSEFICVDAKAEVLPGTGSNHNGRLLYPVEAACGVLKCPPYHDGREMTCVVCSK